MAVGLLWGCTRKNQLPDLKERYQYKDTRPFGAYTAYNLMGEIYPDKYINISDKPFAKFYADTYVDSASLYINISNKFYADEDDAKALVEFVSEGNTAFIAASYIDSTVLGKVLSRQASLWMNAFIPRQFVKTHVQLSPAAYRGQDSFSYYYLPFNNYFSEIDPGMGRAVGYNSNRRPNCAVFFIGKGRLYLHCDPRAFSNYFLLTANNYSYLKQLMQMLGNEPWNIFWDDYYNKRNFRDDEGGSMSGLDTILRNPPLAMAFWIVLGMLVFYILFNGKRKQRVIPIIKPVDNTSIAFTQAIAGLYMAERNNRTIADKMITYLNEHVRTRYFLSSQVVNQAFITTLSKKSGVPAAAVESLFNTIREAQASEDLSDFELLSLNEQIQEFYKTRI
jgi:predicted nucleic acid-binding protein